MVDRGSNIDIVFRNGLKDFEVLPPPEVWNNIHPVIKAKQRSLIFLKAAALIAVLLTLSFLAYRWSSEVSTDFDSTVTALNEDTASSGIFQSIDIPVNGTIKRTNSVKPLNRILINNIPEPVIETENQKILSPEVAYLQETSSLSMSGTGSMHGPYLASLNSRQKSSFETKEQDQLYLQDFNAIKIPERWSIAAMASPTYYSRFNAGSSDLSNEIVTSEQPVISYSGGVAFAYKINKRFSIQSGLYYSSLDQDVTGINSFGGFQKYNNTKGGHNFEVLTTNGTIYTNNADVFLMANGSGERIITNFTKDVFDPQKASLQYINNTMRQNLSYLEMPVVLRYKVIDKTIDVNLIGGVSYNLLVNNSAYTIVDGGKYPIGKTAGLNPISLSSLLGMGMEYSFSENFSLNLEPTFRYYMNPFNASTGLKIHPYSFGIFSGISYKF
jgi:hypothetical protein